MLQTWYTISMLFARTENENLFEEDPFVEVVLWRCVFSTGPVFFI